MKKHIYLIGFSGSGKSTVGPGMARRMKRRFVDLDHEIERSSGMSISDIFKRRGEREFRKREHEMLSRVGARTVPHVVALGGGAFESLRNRKIVSASGFSVYLSCSIRELYRRLSNKKDRPLLHAVSGVNTRQVRMARIASLLAVRKKNYLEADMRISTTDKTVAQVVKEVLHRIRNYHVTG